MPVYEYRCPCGYRFTDLQVMPGQPQKTCPECGKRARKIVSAVGFVVKGGHRDEYDAYGPRRK